MSQSVISSQLGLVPSRPIEPVTHGRSSGNAALPSSALATPAPSLSATAMTSSVARSAPAPTRIATFLPAFSTSAARRRSASYGTTFGFAEADAGMHRAVLARRFLVGRFLQIVGQHDGGDAALADGDAHGAVDQMAHLRRHARPARRTRRPRP